MAVWVSADPWVGAEPWPGHVAEVAPNDASHGHPAESPAITQGDSGWVNIPALARVAAVTVAAQVGAAFGSTAPTIGSLVLYVR